MKKTLIEELNKLDVINDEKLIEYVEFCLSNKTNKIKFKSALHHILPGAKLLPFGKYKNLKETPWNGVYLLHKDHYYAHFLLSQAVNHISILHAFRVMHLSDCKLNKLSECDLIDLNKYQDICERSKREFSKYFKGSNAKKAAAKMVKTKKQTICENGKSILENSTIKRNITRINTIDENGKSINKINGEKTRETRLNDIDKNNKNSYQHTANTIYNNRDKEYRVKKSENSAQTMKKNGTYIKTAKKHKKYQNEIMLSGMTRAQETGKKVSKTRKKKIASGEIQRLTGELNGSAIKVKIFNSEDILMYECNGTFEKICKEHSLPRSFLKRSYQSDGIRFTKTKGMTYDFYKRHIQFEGWYAVKE